MRDPVNSLTHLTAAALAVAGVIPLWTGSRGDLPKQISLLIFGASLALMYLSSAAYHMLPASPERRLLLRRIDHSFAFILTAGTYTPVCFTVLIGGWRWGMLAMIWSLAALGVLFKVFFLHVRRWFYTSIYVVMGWMIILAMGQLARMLPATAIGLMFAGGITYTVGAMIYAIKRPNPIPGFFGFHEIWHLFAIGGSAFFYIMILLYVVPFDRG